MSTISYTKYFYNNMEEPLISAPEKVKDLEILMIEHEEILQSELAKISGEIKHNLGSISALAFSRDGNKLALVSSANHTINILDMITLKIIGTKFEEYEHNINAISYSANGDSIVIGSQDGTVKVLETSGREIFSFNAHDRFNPINSVAVSNNLIASGDEGGSIILWDIHTAQLRHEFKQKAHPVSSVAFDEFETFLAAGNSKGFVTVYRVDDIDHPDPIYNFKGHENTVTAVKFISRNELVTSSHDQIIKVWTLENLEYYSINVLESPIKRISINKDCSYLVAAAEDNSILVWNLKQRVQERKLTAHTNDIHDIAFSPEGNYFVSCSEDQTIRIWNVKNKKDTYSFKAHDKGIGDIILTHSNRMITSSRDNSIRFWNMNTFDQEDCIKGSHKHVLFLTLTPDGKFFVSGDRDHLIKVWNIETKKLEYQLTGHTGDVWAVVVSSNYRYLVSGSEDRLIKVWNYNERVLEFELTGHEDIIYSLLINNANTHIFSGSKDFTIRIWDIQERIGINIIQTGIIIYNIRFGMQETYLCAAADDKSLRVWTLIDEDRNSTIQLIDEDGNSVIPGPQLIDFNGQDFLRIIKANPNHDEYIAAGSGNGWIFYWNLRENRLEFKLEIHSDVIKDLNFSSDGTLLATGSFDFTIKILNIAERLILRTIKPNCNSIYSLIFLPNDYLVCGSLDGSIKLFDNATNKEHYIFQTKLELITSIAIDQTDNYLFIADLDKIKVLDIKEKLFRYELQDEEGIHLAFKSRGNQILSASRSRRINLRNFNSNDDPDILGEQMANVISISLSRDQNLLLSLSEEGEVKVFDIEQRKVRYEIPAAHEVITKIEINSTNTFLYTAKEDFSIGVWNLERRQEDYSLFGHGGKVFSLLVFASDTLLASGSGDNTIKIWNLVYKRIECSLQGHLGPVTSLALSLDKNSLISGSEDGLIKVWEIYQNRAESTTKWSSDYVKSIAITPNGDKLIGGCNTGNICVWDIENQSLESTLIGHVGEVLTVKINSQGTRIASGANNIKIWNLNQRKEEFTIGYNIGTNYALIFYREDELISGSQDGNIRFWDLSKKVLKNILEGYEPVFSISITFDNKILASASADNLIKIWDLDAMQQLRIFEAHNARIRSLDFRPNTQILFSASDDKTIKSWDIDEGNRLETYRFHNNGVNSITFSGDGENLLSCSSDNTVVILKIDFGIYIKSKEIHSRYIYDAKFSPNYNYFYTCSNDCLVKSWDFNSINQHFFEINDRVLNYELTEVSIIKKYSRGLSCLAIVPKNGRIVSASEDDKLVIIDTHTKDIEYISPRQTEQNEHITIIQISPNSDSALIGFSNGKINVWDFDSKSISYTLRSHTDSINAIEFIPDSRYLLTCSKDKRIKKWRLENGRYKEVFTLSGHTQSVNCMVVYSQLEFITASADKTIRIWNSIQNKEIKIIEGHTESIQYLKLIRNSTELVSVGMDKYIRIWDVRQIYETREKISFKCLSYNIQSFNADTNSIYLFIGLSDNTIRIFNILNKREEFKIFGHSGIVNSLQFTTDGRYLVSCSLDNTLKFWAKQIDIANLTRRNSIRRVKRSKSRVSFDTPNVIAIEHADDNSRIASVFPDITYTFENSYQDQLLFYNIMHCIESQNYSYLSADTFSIVFTRYGFTIVHILCYLGKSVELKALLTPDFYLRTDNFGNSPLYFSIEKLHQSCTDILITFLCELFERKDSFEFLTSMNAIKNNFVLIIKNSSISLNVLLQNLIIKSEISFGKIEKKLPLFANEEYYIPNIKSFETQAKPNKVVEIPLVLQSIPFKIPCTIGSESCVELSQAIVDCNNSEIYKTTFIQYLIRIQWRDLQVFIVAYCMLLFFNLIFLIIFNQTQSLYASVPFVLINLILILWEVLQFIIEPKEYFTEMWNIIDISRCTTTIIWFILKLNGFQISSNFTWPVMLLNFMRGLTGFRLFDGTRYYISLIIRALDDMKYFVIMFSYSTITFGVLFLVSRDTADQDPDLSFASLWMISYRLSFGDYADPNSQDLYTIETMTFISVTFINVVLMLNLLISILSDTYEHFQLDRDIIDFKERAQFTLEIQKLMFWVNKKSDYKYLHVLSMHNDQGSSAYWPGKLKNTLEVIKKEGQESRAKILDLQHNIELMNQNVLRILDHLQIK